MLGISPSLVLLILGIGGSLGVIGYTYAQGKQSCVSYYEAQLLATRLKNQMDEIKNYQDQQEYNNKLVSEAQTKALTLEKKTHELQLKIDKIPPSGYVCVSSSFLYELIELRHFDSQKEGAKPSK